LSYLLFCAALFAACGGSAAPGHVKKAVSDEIVAFGLNDVDLLVRAAAAGAGGKRFTLASSLAL
jgi:hypothetical protein